MPLLHRIVPLHVRCSPSLKQGCRVKWGVGWLLMRGLLFLPLFMPFLSCLARLPCCSFFLMNDYDLPTSMPDWGGGSAEVSHSTNRVAVEPEVSGVPVPLFMRGGGWLGVAIPILFFLLLFLFPVLSLVRPPL